MARIKRLEGLVEDSIEKCNQHFRMYAKQLEEAEGQIEALKEQLAKDQRYNHDLREDFDALVHALGMYRQLQKKVTFKKTGDLEVTLTHSVEHRASNIG